MAVDMLLDRHLALGLSLAGDRHVMMVVVDLPPPPDLALDGCFFGLGQAAQHRGSHRWVVRDLSYITHRWAHRSQTTAPVSSPLSIIQSTEATV